MLSFFTYSLQTLQMSMASVACDCTPLTIGKIYTYILNVTNYKNRVSTMRCRPDNVLNDNRYTVPPNRTLHHSSFTIARYPGTHCNISRDALPSPRGDVFAAMFFVLRIQSADATEFTGPFQLQKTFDSSGQCSNRSVGTQGQRKDIVSGQEICSGKCHECQVLISN